MMTRGFITICLALAICTAQLRPSLRERALQGDPEAQFNLAKKIPGKQEFAESVAYYGERLRRAGAQVLLNRPATDAELAPFDEIVLASGIEPRKPAIPGIDHKSVTGYVDLLSGRIQVGGDQLATSLTEIRAGQLKALATNGSKRIAELPNVPTVRELGFASLEFEGWNGLLAPAKTPRAVIEKLARETTAAVRHPDLQKRFSDLGAEPVGSSPEEQKAMYLRQMKQFTPVIKEMNLD